MEKIIKSILLISLFSLGVLLIFVSTMDQNQEEQVENNDLNMSNVFKYEGDCKTFNALTLNETHCYRGYSK